MIPGRRAALLFLLAAILVAIGGFALSRSGSPQPLPARAENERPKLLLLTSLPLVFGEGFSLHDNGSAALKALETRYRVVPISVAEPAELAKGRLLLMAQPRAQPAEDLVALDEWVRAGGRLLLLADPMLEWPSERPLGDALRPVMMFADTGLLAHWGLRLDSPERRGESEASLGRYKVLTLSPGQLSGGCAISNDRLEADCRIGKGRAIVLADADFLAGDRLGDDAAHNLDGLLEELARLEQPIR
ncbi:MAG: DUF4350 domain-containing protein [Bacillota bacterium]